MAGLPQIAGEPVTVALPELERAVTELGLVGCLLNPDPYEGDGIAPPLGDEYWYPLYAKLVELDVPALIHSASCRNGRESYSSHFITEEGIGIVSLCNSRVFEDFPTLKLISAHGGPVPYQIGRWRASRWRGGQEVGEADEPGHLFFDTVLACQESIELLLKILQRRPLHVRNGSPASGRPATRRRGGVDDLKPIIEALNGWASPSGRGFEGTARRVQQAEGGGVSLLDRLRQLDSCAVSDALDTLGLAGATTGIRALWPVPGVVAGRAGTSGGARDRQRPCQPANRRPRERRQASHPDRNRRRRCPRHWLPLYISSRTPRRRWREP
jgi:hypothetical protein